jgi:hypothetical protein
MRARQTPPIFETRHENPHSAVRRCLVPRGGGGCAVVPGPYGPQVVPAPVVITPGYRQPGYAYPGYGAPPAVVYPGYGYRGYGRGHYRGHYR